MLKITVWLQKSVLIQPRKRLSKFADAYVHHPPPVRRSALATVRDEVEGGWILKRFDEAENVVVLH